MPTQDPQIKHVVMYKRFINRTKVNRKACLAEAEKLTLPDQTVAQLAIKSRFSLLLLQIMRVKTIRKPL